MGDEQDAIEISQWPALVEAVHDVSARRAARPLALRGRAVAVLAPLESAAVAPGVPLEDRAVDTSRQAVPSGPDLASPAAVGFPSAQELARRQALVATVLRNREQRQITPLTAADLVHQARTEVGAGDEPAG